MKEVLIIGNGVSRLKYQRFIQTWKGEVWGCNSIYLEHQAGSIPRLDRLIGDRQAIIPAAKCKRKYRHNYVIYNKVVINKKQDVAGTVPVPLPTKYIRDSGTALVALAFLEDYDKIVCLGFDLGGKDIYVKDLHTKNKSTWVKHWRRLAEDFDFDKLEFVGYDHKPFILSNEPYNMYAEKYLNGENHIPEDDLDTKLDFKVLLLCKGKQHLTEEQKEFVDSWEGEIWLYNTTYYNQYKDKLITRLIATTQTQAEKFNIDGSSYSLYYPDNATYRTFKEVRKGWNWTLLMLIQSLYESYDNVYIIWKEIKQKKFQNQLSGILKEYNAEKRVHII